MKTTSVRLLNTLQCFEPKLKNTTLALCGAVALILCSAASAKAALPTIDSLHTGTLATGEKIFTAHVTFHPGDEFPWHYHTGAAWVTVLEGVLTEDEGCGSELNHYGIGDNLPSAFTEEPGRVHRAFNDTDKDVVLLWSEIYSVEGTVPGIGTTIVDGPDCEGSSGRAHLVKIK